ncbi:hypothetical protein BBBOND_0211880 [Babesia bigemina]|uniref:Uncharacterized protein n=1 Tax=Babesia bigemina TaxID=5866 RepID=A0A061D5P6_BABBI|nr:hypothetical protein BBBOND_0211880 [Babesia bigemina]CDR96046.1 hypothetical protein BBBOND_0211880 [Babesia bigemina]|eukprot:XP_012768232.1 hypothetical protein BBBOND_0211880 [Babesia bigemina]
MATDDPEDAYAQFMFSEHQTATTLPDSATSGTPTPAPASNSKYEYDIRDNEKSRILRLIVRLLLHRAPFVTRYDEIRAVVKTYLHDHANHAIVNCFIGEYDASLQFQYGAEDAKKLVSKTLGLILCDIKLQGARREFFLKQSLAFQPHDLKLLGDGDHELRGFLLLLLPCFKAYTTGIPLGMFTRVGKADMVPRDQASEEALKAALRGTRRKRAVKYSASEFSNIADYLLYARELGYLSLVTDPKKGDTLAVITVMPGYRLLFELDQESYVKQLSTLELDEGLKRTLEAFFDR